MKGERCGYILKKIHFHELMKHLNLSGGDETKIQGVTQSHREVKPGWLFLAKAGAHIHGGVFMEEVLRQGGVVLCEKREILGKDALDHKKVVYCDRIDHYEAAILLALYGKVWEQVTLVGVSGTNGKSSVSHLIAQLWKENQVPYLWIGTDGMSVNGKQYPSERTTPCASKLFSLLDEALEQKITHVVMEVSSQAIMQGRCTLLRFDTVLLNSITSDHLDDHITKVQYRYTKFSLRWYLKEQGTMIVFHDSKEMKEIDQFKIPHLITVGEHGAHMQITPLSCTLKGSCFRLNDYLFQTPLIGAFQIHNLAMVIAYGRSIRLSYRLLQKQIPLLQGKEGRMELFRADEKMILIDYAHTSSALASLLHDVKALKEAKQRMITVFGCGGERDASKRREMTQIACAFSDVVIATSDNPRGEAPWQILMEMIAFPSFRGVVIENRQFAIKYALTNAKKNDIILICGRGSEKVQLVKQERLPYCDKETVLRILEGGFPCLSNMLYHSESV